MVFGPISLSVNDMVNVSLQSAIHLCFIDIYAGMTHDVCFENLNFDGCDLIQSICPYMINNLALKIIISMYIWIIKFPHNISVSNILH